MKVKRGTVPGLTHYPVLYLDLSVSYLWLLLQEDGGCGSFRVHWIFYLVNKTKEKPVLMYRGSV